MSVDKELPKNKQKNYLTSFYHTKILLNEILEHEGIVVDIDETIVKDIIKEYPKHLKCLRRVMDSMGEKDRVDSHKVSALFLMLIIKHKNVVSATSKTTETTTFNTIPHIYFAFVYGVVIMESIYNIDKKEKVVFNINTTYVKEFVKLIYANKDIVTIPVMMPKCEKEFSGIFLLSHLFYFIEKTADKQPDTL